MAGLGEFPPQIRKMGQHRPLVLKPQWFTQNQKPSLDYWCRSTFEIFGDHFGGLIDVATKTLNLTNFGGFEFLNPPRPSKVPLLLDDFKNSIDRLRIGDVLLDEDFDLSSFPLVLNVLKSVFVALPGIEILLKFCSFFRPYHRRWRKRQRSVDSDLITRASEQSPSLNIAGPKINCCSKMAAGPTSIDFVFKTPVDKEPSSERNKEKKPI